MVPFENRAHAWARYFEAQSESFICQMIPTVRLVNVRAMSLRWWVKTARGITEQTEKAEQTEETPETAPEAEAVTFGIGLAQTQHPRTYYMSDKLKFVGHCRGGPWRRSSQLFQRGWVRPVFRASPLRHFSVAR